MQKNVKWNQTNIAELICQIAEGLPASRIKIKGARIASIRGATTTAGGVRLIRSDVKQFGLETATKIAMKRRKMHGKPTLWQRLRKLLGITPR